MRWAFGLGLLGGVAACSSQQAHAPALDPPAAEVGARPTSVPLARNVHPLARAEYDIGRLDEAKVIRGASLLLRPTSAQATAATVLLRALADPTSPAYHRWLTPESVRARFGASDAELARMTSWLASRGLTVLGPSRSGTQLFFSGTVGQVEDALQAEVHGYEVDDEAHFALASPPRVPSELSGRVLGVHGVDDFGPRPPRVPARALGSKYKSSVYGVAIAPADFAALYDLRPLYDAGTDGTGMSVAVVGSTYYVPSDIADFRSTFGLPPPKVTDVLVPNTGTSSVVGAAGYLSEAEIDIEWAGAIAPNADVEYVYTGELDSYGVFDALLYALNERIAPVVSISYGACEQAFAGSDVDFVPIYGTIANLEGITIVSATGDTASAGCDVAGDPTVTAAQDGPWVSIPASSPWVTGVGGTAFPYSSQHTPYWSAAGAALEYDPLEQAWNDTTAAHGLIGGGGGRSVLFPKPFYQSAATPADGARDVPDVSLSASLYETPYIFVSSNVLADGGTASNGVVAGGGTSFTAPAFAGILTLVNQALAAKTPSAPVGLGDANPVLYALSTSAPGAFHDITFGNNIVPCVSGSPGCPASGKFGYSAGPGYDLVTGLGSIDATALVAAWASLVPTTTALLPPTPATPGETTAVTLSATVTPASSPTALTGDVTFLFETYADDAGTPGESWSLGSAPITASTGGGTASLTTTIPAGMYGQSDVVASYGGDTHYLASSSTKVRIDVTGVQLVASPPTLTMNPGTFATFTATGGVAPVQWLVLSDTTCDPMLDCSELDPSAGLLEAGPVDGQIFLQAVDSLGAQSEIVLVTVSGPYIDAGPFPNLDAGSGLSEGGAFDGGGTTPQEDAGSADAGTAVSAGDAGDAGDDGANHASDASDVPDGRADAGTSREANGGCSCGVAGTSAPPASSGLLGGIGLAALVARRARRRSLRSADGSSGSSTRGR